MYLATVIHYASFFSVLLPLTAAITTYKSLTGTLRILSVFVFFTALIEISSMILSLQLINNMFLFHLFTLIEFAFLMAFFGHISGNSKARIIALITAIAFIGYALTEASIHQSFDHFNSQQRSVEGIIILLCCINYFITLIRNDRIEMANPLLWLVSGLFIYFSGTLFLFAYADKYLISSEHNYWTIHSILNIFLNLTFAISLWKGRQVSI